MTFGFGVGIQRLGSVGVPTLAALNALPAPGAGIRPTGLVYADPTVSNNGVYTWNGSAWSKARALPDQVARLTVTGGTANAITATAQPGVDPATTLMVLLTPSASNTGAVTLNGKPVKSRSGADLISGAFAAGTLYALIDLGSEYRVFLNNFADIADVADLQAALDAKANASAVADALALKADAAPTAAALDNRLRFDAAQSLTAAQQGRARANIGGGVLSGFRNKIINGDFDIWQRATTQTTSGYGSDDRWVNAFIGGSLTHSRQAFSIGQAEVPGSPGNFSRSVVTHAVGASNYHIKEHRIENVRTFSGRRNTLTFYAKADAAKNIAVEFYQSFGTGGSPSAQVQGIGARLIALTTAWQKFTFTVDIPSIAGKVIGTNANDYLGVIFWFEAGSSLNARTANLGQQSGTFDIAHVSFVEGDATAEEDPFSALHPQQVLALCQRYYTIAQTMLGTSTISGAFVNQRGLPVEMRVAPSVVLVSIDAGSGATFQTGNGFLFQNAGNSQLSGAFIHLDAEL